MRNIHTTFLVVVSSFAVLLTSCHSEIAPLKEGLWRGSFVLPANEIPFVFEVRGNSVDSTTVFLVNGEDRFKSNKVCYRNDSVSIPIDLYDVVLKGKLTNNTLEGNFIKTAANREITKVPFKADMEIFPDFRQTTYPLLLPCPVPGM